MKTHSRSDENLEDFCDGTLFKSHELFSQKPLALQLIIYYDDVEVCNPLGSYRGVHKLGKFDFCSCNHANKLTYCATTPHMAAGPLLSFHKYQVLDI